MQFGCERNRKEKAMFSKVHLFAWVDKIYKKDISLGYLFLSQTSTSVWPTEMIWKKNSWHFSTVSDKLVHCVTTYPCALLKNGFGNEAYGLELTPEGFLAMASSTWLNWLGLVWRAGAGQSFTRLCPVTLLLPRLLFEMIKEAVSQPYTNWAPLSLVCLSQLALPWESKRIPPVLVEQG